MLRLFFVFVCVIFLAGDTCLGQVDKRRSEKEDQYSVNILKVGVLSPFLGIVNIQYEIKHTPNTASQLEFFYFTGVFLGELTGYKGVGVTYNFRYYANGTFPEGFYIQPFGRIQKYDDTGVPNPTVAATQPYANVNVFGAGIVFGYQKFFTRRFSFDLCAGPVYNVAYADGARASGQEIGSPFNGGWIRIGTSIGYAF